MKFVHICFRYSNLFWTESNRAGLLNRENSANPEVPEPKFNEKHMIKSLSIIFLRGFMMNIFVKREQIWDIAQSAVNENFFLPITLVHCFHLADP